MPKAIVIGASSGIGRALCKVLSKHGYVVGMVARRLNLLLDLQNELSTPTFVKQVDVTKTSEATHAILELIQEMGHVDLIVVNAGVIFNNRDLSWDPEATTIDVNVKGFASMAHLAMQYFLSRGYGHLVGISSISALRGDASSPAYGASKAFVSNYLEALRVRAFREKKKITVTDIKPGWVDTVMAEGEETFWMATAEEAAKQIFSAISRKRDHAYITARWRLIAWLLKLTPRCIYNRYF